MENLLKQEDIAVTTINQRYYADITLIPTKEGWLYLAAVMDAYSRRIIRRLGASLTGYAMNDNMQTDLVIQALRMATKQRRPPKGLIHHSDRGSQFTSHAFARELVSWGFRQSFTATGACLDNAYIESFFATLKKELVYQNAFATREEARNALFAYINMTYNRYRLHSSLGYQSPDAFEATSTNSPWRWRLRLYLLCPRTSTNSNLSGNSPLNAASLQGKSYYLADRNTDSARRNSLRVWYKINQVYNWERSAHNLYDTFPLSTVYPDGNPIIFRSRAHFGRMYIEAGDGTNDATLFHEFGHEVYYRRMLGGASYGGYHRDAVATNNTSAPACAGYANPFLKSYWQTTEGCVAMLEGFAEWFSAVLYSSSPSTKVYRIKPSQFDASVGGREVPVDFRAEQIAFACPSTHFLRKQG